jgi:phosphoglycolate phosphatase-like HAD superfamily hydrolase
MIHSPSSFLLVLFDIDGTLLNTDGAGKRAFSRALHKVFGWDTDLAQVSFAGATDLLVIRNLIDEYGHPYDEAQVQQFFRQLPVELEETVKDAGHTLHPGVPELLAALEKRPDVLLGLVTGNIASCARIKLRIFELEKYFPFGGFGDDHPERADIARAAIARARERLPEGAHLAGTFLIGDSLSDVAAAREVGATCVAVTTGWHSHRELAAAGAHHIVDDFSDTRGMLELLAAN